MVRRRAAPAARLRVWWLVVPVVQMVHAEVRPVQNADDRLMEDPSVTMNRERPVTLHALHLACGLRQCDGLTQMGRCGPSFGSASPRF